MTALLINGLSVLMLLFFGAMALYPLLFSDRAVEHTVEHANEDRVLHISPAPMIEPFVPAASGHQPVVFGSPRSDADSSRREREAA